MAEKQGKFINYYECPSCGCNWRYSWDHQADGKWCRYRNVSPNFSQRNDQAGKDAEILEPAVITVNIWNGIINGATVEGLPGPCKVLVIEEDTDNINDQPITEHEYEFINGEEIMPEPTDHD